MIRYSINSGSKLSTNESKEGEPIEAKIARVLQNSEPIKDGAPLIYTPRAEGVQAQHNIRTDRFDVALNAMDKVSASYTARRENKAEMKIEKGEGGAQSSESNEGKKDAS